jgi:hypothetical protein
MVAVHSKNPARWLKRWNKRGAEIASVIKFEIQSLET